MVQHSQFCNGKEFVVDGKVVFTVLRQNADEAVGEDNFNLINAAPKLLIALEGLLSSYAADFETITGGKLNNTDSVKKAKAIIAEIRKK